MRQVRPGTTQTFSPNAMTWKERIPRLPARAILPPQMRCDQSATPATPARPVSQDMARHLPPQAARFHGTGTLDIKFTRRIDGRRAAGDRRRRARQLCRRGQGRLGGRGEIRRLKKRRSTKRQGGEFSLALPSFVDPVPELRNRSAACLAPPRRRPALSIDQTPRPPTDSAFPPPSNGVGLLFEKQTLEQKFGTVITGGRAAMQINSSKRENRSFRRRVRQKFRRPAGNATFCDFRPSRA